MARVVQELAGGRMSRDLAPSVLTDRTLVLNVTYQPLSIVSVRRALLLVIADKAEKIDAIEKLQEENSRLVQALSLAFEVNQSQAEALTQQLLIGPEYEEGTVLDLFI